MKKRAGELAEEIEARIRALREAAPLDDRVQEALNAAIGAFGFVRGLLASGNMTARVCEICGGPLPPIGGRPRTICEKASCARERQRRWSRETYRRSRSAARSGRAATAARSGATDVGHEARMEAIRRAQQRVAEAEENGGRVPNRRDPEERRDPMEA